VTDIIVVRQLADEVWQWRFADNRTGWRDDQIHSGDLEALRASVSRPGTPAFYLLPGETVVTQRITAEVKERRHLQKLVPYQLEEQAIEPVDELHFSLGPVRDGKLAVAYTELAPLQEAIQQLESAGCDVKHCAADFLMLPRSADGWALHMDNERLLVHYGEGLGMATELVLTNVVLAALVQHQKAPAYLDLSAPDDAGLEHLRSLLPETLAAKDDLDIETRQAGFWDLLDPMALPELDFRSGALGRRLPLTRWWRDWRIPLIATASAFVLAIGVTAGQYWQAQERQEEIMEEMRAVYRQAVPNADENVRDPERRLSSLVSGLGGTTSSSNVMYLLSEVAPAIESKEGLRVSSFRYSSDNRELQLNLEADDFSLLEALRTDIAQRGLTAELLRVSAQGDVHQARMRVVEGTL
jgi:general secretion pathway protein L